MVTADCLHLPYRNDIADAVISIAVIHHLSTHERRKATLEEIARVLKPKGRALIYVWAKDQKKNSVPSAYMKHCGKKNRDNECEKIEDEGSSLPIHENGTNFAHGDVLVPWKRKGGGEFLRYYHVFDEGELEQLCAEIASVIVEKVYYDQGNWCVIVQKRG